MKTLLISDFLYPTQCYGCRVLITKKEIFCSLCARDIVPPVSKVIPITASHSMTVYAASLYTPPMKSLIVKKLYNDRGASIRIAELIMLNTAIASLKPSLFIPIPLHWMRYAWRGFNQASLISQVLAKNLSVDSHDLLKRQKRTIFQSRLSKEARHENVKDAFCLRRTYKKKISALVYKKHIVLVDDLMTTGATLRAAARMLLPFKPASINVVVGARV